MNDLTTIDRKNEQAVKLFTDIQAKATELATCAHGDIPRIHDELITALIDHNRFNHGTQAVTACAKLYSRKAHGHVCGPTG